MDLHDLPYIYKMLVTQSHPKNILQISSFYLFDIDAVKDLFPFDVKSGWSKRKYLIVENEECIHCYSSLLRVKIKIRIS